MSNQQQTKQQKNALRHVGATAPPRPNCMETEEEKKLNLFLPQVLYTKKMSSYQEQLAKCKSSTEKYNTIWKNKEWTIKDYEDLFTDIERGYIIQGDFDTHHNYFIINPAFEE